MAPRIFIFIYFFKYGNIETHARAFLTLNILAIGGVTLSLPCSPVATLELHTHKFLHQIKDFETATQILIKDLSIVPQNTPD